MNAINRYKAALRWFENRNNPEMSEQEAAKLAWGFGDVCHAALHSIVEPDSSIFDEDAANAG